MSHKTFKRIAIALLAVSPLSVIHSAFAAGTAAGTTINNRATVNYTVGGNAQPLIESSPTGNSTPGANNGTNTAFLVDNKIDLTVTAAAASIVVNPGQTGAAASFTVANTGNAPQAYQLAAANLTGGTVLGNTDTTDVTITGVFVESGANAGYQVAEDTATSIATLAPGATAITVYVIATVPATTVNGQFANVRLTASTAVNNTPATLVTETTGVESPTVVDVVFADGAGAGDAARDGKHSADDDYAIRSAALSVAKTSAVISDPFNGTASATVFPKSIPGAVIEYALTVTNTGTVAANGIAIADPLPANTTFVSNAYSAGTRDVSITVGATTTFCIAEAGGTDTNADGCVRTVGGALQVGAPALVSVATGAANAATVRFRVSIN